MFTAARLVAALILACTAWVVSEQIVAIWPQDRTWTRFSLINTGIGFFCGWFVIGNRTARGQTAADALAIGLTGAAALVFWGFLIWAGKEALNRALDRRYDGPIEGLLDIVTISGRYGQNILHAHIIAILVLGGLIAGLAARFTAARWR